MQPQSMPCRVMLTEKLENLFVQVSQSEKIQLKIMAAEEGVSLAQIVRRALRKELKLDKPKKKR